MSLLSFGWRSTFRNNQFKGIFITGTRRSSPIAARFSSTMAFKASSKPAEDFLEYINASPTPYHAVHEAKARLDKAGYKQIKERDPWASTLVPGGKYYVTRNASTIIAFAIGKKWKPGNPLAMVGAHTDSCVLRLKPTSKRQSDGWLQFGVETYGGGMWHTWFDRDLGIAGRVLCKTDKGIEAKLVNINRPICRIPSLAVHFGGSVPFEFNKETQLFPIAGLVEAELKRLGKTEEEIKKEEAKDTEFQPLRKPKERHLPRLLELIADEAGVAPETIEDFELILYDVQKSCLGGLNNELVLSARLDNLMMTYCAIKGLINSTGPNGKSLDDETTIRLAAGFDHEEVGSTSAQGANGSMMLNVTRRLSCLPASHNEADSDASYDKVSHSDSDAGSSTAFEQSLATSFLVSADMAHSVNPNYGEKHEREHRPLINKGTVIKVNANQRYATNSPGIVLMQEMARRAKRASYDARSEGDGVPLQLFVVRNDCPCGSTIGPMMSANTGIRTLDLGNPQLAMHSIRETGGVYDVEHAINLFESFYEHYGELESKIFVD
ncbi:aspartyl aminopeptidase [Myriangium duriaei CBS 260.36]|uniref:aspartyl aminopeptidase n=1 Tax=Myriangium duriaei CBS 260.36 TaxID=1168546 RepID=A0A9P4J4E7_9PEZI|nr:aspartyl aminopeptidase [Myriangium duriaei CBS 260.36]